MQTQVQDTAQSSPPPPLQPRFKTSGQRLSFLRKISGKTRAEIFRIYGLPEVSLRQLEHDTYRLRDKTAQKCYEIYTQEGICVTLEWIKEGRGMDPLMATSLNQSGRSFQVQTEDASVPTHEVSLIQEAYTFQKGHPRAVTLFVTGDEMGPFYQSGSYIGGIFYDVNNQDHRQVCAGKDCIVELECRSLVFRRLRPIEGSSCFNLVALNPATSSDPVLYSRAVLRAAPVVWFRRPLVHEEREDV